MERIHTKGIVVFDELMQVAVPLEVNPFTNQFCVVPFSQRIVGIVETVTTSSLILDGEVISEGSTFTDYYGFLTSTQDMWNAKTPSHPVVRETTIITTLSYYVREKSNANNKFNLGYHPLPHNWCDVGVDAPEANTVENMNTWFNTPIFERYVKGEDEQFHPIMPEPVSLESKIVDETKFNSTQPLEERLQLVEQAMRDIAKKYVYKRPAAIDDFIAAIDSMCRYASSPKD